MTPLDEIKQLYYAATRATIERDFDHAIELLKSLTSEDERERATVYMTGLAELKSEWKAGKKYNTKITKNTKTKTQKA